MGKFIVNSLIVNPYCNLFHVRTIRMRIIYLHMYIKLNFVFYVFQSLYLHKIFVMRAIEYNKSILVYQNKLVRKKTVNNKRHLPRAITECICIESYMHKV